MDKDSNLESENPLEKILNWFSKNMLNWTFRRNHNDHTTTISSFTTTG